MTTVRPPQDHKPTAASQKAAQKKADEAMTAYLDTGLDFTPFTIDVGDGIEWGFKPDLLPADLSNLSRALKGLDTASNDSGDLDGMAAAFETLASALRDMLIEDDQKVEFPKPMYGIRALTFFGVRVVKGRTGFPTA